MHGWRLTLLPRWTSADVGAVLGVPTRRSGEAGEAEAEAEAEAEVEAEDPECIAVVTIGDPAPFVEADPGPWVRGARAGAWVGAPNLLSPAHVPWPVIDGVAAATEYGDVHARAWSRVRAVGGCLGGGGVTCRGPPPLPSFGGPAPPIMCTICPLHATQFRVP